jgi:hypothetical protein
MPVKRDGVLWGEHAAQMTVPRFKHIPTGLGILRDPLSSTEVGPFKKQLDASIDCFSLHIG